jgi:hypothetical protein
MKEIVEATLKSVTEDAQRLQAEVTNLEQALSRKRADLLATSGAIQVLQMVLRKASEEKPKD